MTEVTGDSVMARAESRVGTVLRGKYRLDRVLGIGGMAVVYKATHRNEAEFAVKMLHPEFSVREEVRNRFLREGRAANSVKHPGVVLVVDDDVAEDGSAFLVMELLDGGGVESLWERCGMKMPVRAAVSIGVQLLDVLAAAHARGIVHRDLKPANLFAAPDGAVKVLDFGIARVKDTAAGAGASASGTSTGLLLGTPSFMAPEQAMGKSSEIDARTDLWAVGATIFSLITGETVHPAENAVQTVIRAATTRARSLGSVATHVSPELIAVIDRSLAYEANARWPDATTMREALERAYIQTFGEPVSKSVVAGLFLGPESPGNAATLAAPTAIPRLVAAAVAANAPVAAASAFGQTTTAPLEQADRDVAERRPRGGGASRLIALVGGALVAAAGGWFAISASQHDSAGPLAGAALTSGPPATPSAGAVPADPPPAPPVVRIAPVATIADAPAAPAAKTPPQAAPTQPKSTPAPAAKPRPEGAQPPTLHAAPATPPTLTSQPKAAAPKCIAETTYDTDGQPHFKKVCK